MAVYAADRRSRRDFKRAASGQRRISVRIALRNPDLWATREMAHKLGEVLYWLSEDEWSLEFTRREAAPSSAESDRFLFQLSPRTPLLRSPCSAAA